MVTVTRVRDLGGDVLEVTGTVNREEVTAQGWVSAMQNHYPPSAYGKDGHLKPNAEPAEMTDRQKTAYWKSLLTGASSEPVVIFQA